MDGGLPRWIDEGYKVEATSPNPAKTSQDTNWGMESGTIYPVPSMNEAVIRCMSFILEVMESRRLLTTHYQSVQRNAIQLDSATN